MQLNRDLRKMKVSNKQVGGIGSKLFGSSDRINKNNYLSNKKLEFSDKIEEMDEEDDFADSSNFRDKNYHTEDSITKFNTKTIENREDLGEMDDY